jgi:predicted phosphoribosyltransferase
MFLISIMVLPEASSWFHDRASHMPGSAAASMHSGDGAIGRDLELFRGRANYSGSPRNPSPSTSAVAASRLGIPSILTVSNALLRSPHSSSEAPMATERFANRVDAGRRLAKCLDGYAGRSDVIVLALPRGGVPVAAEVAKHLNVPLDVFLVRKLGVPGHPELAMGALAEGGVQVLDERLIEGLAIPRKLVDEIALRERLELDRRDREYRGTRARPDLAQHTVIVVDDGLATGATMEAAILALRQVGPAAVVVAVPVGAPETCQRLRQYADGVVCVETPRDLGAVGRWYDDFTQTTDAEVRHLIGAAAVPRRA